jgi:predicted DNA-binding protein (UPF0251 family)
MDVKEVLWEQRMVAVGQPAKPLGVSRMTLWNTLNNATEPSDKL